MAKKASLTPVTIATTLAHHRCNDGRSRRFAWKLAYRVARWAMSNGRNAPAAMQRARRALQRAGYNLCSNCSHDRRISAVRCG